MLRTALSLARTVNNVNYVSIIFIISETFSPITFRLLGMLFYCRFRLLDRRELGVLDTVLINISPSLTPTSVCTNSILKSYM